MYGVSSQSEFMNVNKKLIFASFFACACLLFFYSFSTHRVIAQNTEPSLSDADRRRQTFEIVWQTVNDNYFDPTFGGLDWNTVKSQYTPRVAKTANDEELHNLLQEMLNLLKQSHFVIIPPPTIAQSDSKQEPQNETNVSENLDFNVVEQMTNGIGIDLRIINGNAVVTRVEPNSTAALAGLKTGFIIESIDDDKIAEIIEQLNNSGVYQPVIQHQISHQILFEFFNGAANTNAQIVYLDAEDKPHAITIKRQKLKGKLSTVTPSLPAQFIEFEAKRLKSNVGYIRFNFFSPLTAQKFCATLRSMRDAPGIVIDLRGNGGGLIGAIFGIGGLLETRRINLGTMKSRNDEMKFTVTPQHNSYTGHLVVLIDSTTASASEMLASGLQENNRATVIGEKSAGMTLPSVAMELPTGAVLQYAIADFKTPKGNLLEGRGVTPNVAVQLERRSLLEGRDLQLESAIEQIQQKLNRGEISVAAKGIQIPSKVNSYSGQKPVQSSGNYDPLVNSIIEKYIRAIGGIDAVKRVTSRLSRGTAKLSHFGIELSGTVEILQKSPNKVVQIIKSPNFGVTQTGYTGARSYVQSPATGVMEFDGDELLDDALKADFYEGIKLKQIYPRMSYKGKEKIGDNEAHVVEAVSKDNVPVLFYFDVQSGLLLRRDETYFENYKKIDGVMIPFTIRDDESVINLNYVKQNVLISNTKFLEPKDCSAQ